MARRILGLDLGETSIGSALIRINSAEDLEAIEFMGVRIFQSPLEPKAKTPLNAARRIARGARKRRERQHRRLKKLENSLVRSGLLPLEEILRDVVLGRAEGTDSDLYRDPYALRARAIAERLEPFELGRVFMQLNRRRGFRSNKKTRLGSLVQVADVSLLDEVDEEEVVASLSAEEAKEASETLAAISKLKSDLCASGLTLGAYLASLKGREKIRGLRTSRSMFTDELEHIWNEQIKHHPNLLSLDLKLLLVDSFEQRPLKSPTAKRPKRYSRDSEEIEKEIAGIVKRCRLFSGRSGAKTSHFFAHRFRILQSLVNLRYEQGGETLPLSVEQIRKVADSLQVMGSEKTWATIRKEAGLPKEARFTLEKAGRDKGIRGNKTEAFFSKVYGDRWSCSLELTPEQEEYQLELMQDIDTAPSPTDLYKMLIKPKKNGNPLYGLTSEEAFKLAEYNFDRKVGAYSVRALRKLTTELLNGAESTYHAMEAVRKTVNNAPKMTVDRLPSPPDLPNPRVRRALYEVRKVVNALLDKYEKPEEIVIEFAREITMTKREKDLETKRQDARKKERTAALAFLKDHGLANPSEDEILKYRLWLEADERCPYTGRAIGVTDLLSERTEVEHIWPKHRSADNSFNNLTITFQDTNAAKGNMIPMEWMKDPVEIEEARNRFKAMGNRKKLERFDAPAIPDDFVSRQLNETRYICRAVAEYLSCLGITIRVSSGKATGLLRYKWGLNNIIPPREVKEKKGAKSDQKSGKKERWDHRHHAVDALVVALTTPKRFLACNQSTRQEKKPVPPPLPNFTAHVKEHLSILVTSHHVDRGIRGALHDESFYGRKVINGKTEFVRRVSVSQFAKESFEDAMSALEAVYDPDLRNKLVARLSAFGKPKEAFAGPFDLEFGLKRVRVETVRVRHRLKEESMINLHEGRWVTPNNNHHAEVVRVGKGTQLRVVTMFEVARILRQRHASKTDKANPFALTVKPGEELVMALSIGEVVVINGLTFRVCTLSKGDMRLRDLNDARTGDLGAVRIRSDFEQVQELLIVDPLGQLFTKDGKPYSGH